MQVRFDPASPEGWIVRTAGGRVLAIAPAGRGRADALTAALAGRDGFSAVLDELLRGGISSAPPFALVEFADGAARVVVRGAVRVVSGADEVDGDGVATWVERPFAADSLRVETADGSWSFAAGGPTEQSPAGIPAVSASVASFPTGPVEVTESTIEPAEESVPRHEYLFAPPPLVDVSTLSSTATADDDAEIPGEPEPAAEAGSTPDHDGFTILTGDLPERDAPEPAGDHDGSTVLASEIAGLAGGFEPAPFSMAEAELSLELPDGRVEPLSQPVLLGRSPNLARSTGPLPKLLTVGADDPDISRTHARVAVEGGTVLVTDLGSRNGTSVVLPGRAPQRLREGEPTAVLVGTVIDLGGGVTLTVRED